MDPIKQLSTSLADRTVGLDLIRSKPAVSLRRPPAAETAVKTQDRASFGALPAGKSPAVAAGISQAFSADAQAAFGAPSVRAGGSTPAPKARPLGEDLAWIALKDKTAPELAGYLKDGAVMSMVGMSLLDPGRRRLEHDVRAWIGIDKKSQTPDSLEAEFFKLGVGAKVSGFSKQQLAIEPEVDLVKVRSPWFDDLSLTAGAPINLAGQIHVRAHVQLQKGLDPEADKALDTRIGFDSQDQEFSFRLGLRQRTGQDQALAVYAQQTTPIDGRAADLGVGVYLSQQW